MKSTLCEEGSLVVQTVPEQKQADTVIQFGTLRKAETVRVLVAAGVWMFALLGLPEP